MRAAPICSRLWVISNGLHQYHTYLFEKMEKYLLHFRYSATPGWGAPRFRQLPRWIRLQATRSLSDCEMAQSRCISQRSPPSAILYIRPNTTLVIKNCFGRWWLEWCRNITILKITVGIILDVGLGNHLNSDFKNCRLARFKHPYKVRFDFGWIFHLFPKHPNPSAIRAQSESLRI